jgi:lactoylglutathione lyase
MRRWNAALRAMPLCGALAVSAYAGSPKVNVGDAPPASSQEDRVKTSLLPVVLTDDVPRLKAFYRDVVGLPIQSDEGNFIRFGTGQSHLAIMDRGVVGHIAGERGRIRPGDKGFRFELYFQVEDAQPITVRLQKSGAVMVSALAPRPWGDRAAYFLDPDENLIAVADAKR